MSLSLEEAVELAFRNHPDLLAAKAAQNAARAQEDAAGWERFPHAGVSAQLNRSTGNTPPGAFFPTPGFPAVSGAPRGRALDTGTWQTGVSVWASWDALSPLHAAPSIGVARANEAEAAANIRLKRLDLGFEASDAFLGVLAAREQIRAATASVERAKVFVTMVKALVDQKLRPGADEARAGADLAEAQIALARAEQNEQVRQQELATALGIPGHRVEPRPGGLLSAPPDAVARSVTAPVDSHPALQGAAARVDHAAQQRRGTQLDLLPRLDLVGALWARGSGLYGSPDDGIRPDIANWGAGVVLSWSGLDVPVIQARTREVSARQAEAQAREQSTRLAVQGQTAAAKAGLDGALKVARLTPVALATARQAEAQAIAHYQSSLGTAVEVADTERVLAQADVEDAVARLQVVQARLLLARAEGDLAPFLSAVRAAEGQR